MRCSAHSIGCRRGRKHHTMSTTRFYDETKQKRVVNMLKISPPRRRSKKVHLRPAKGQIVFNAALAAKRSIQNGNVRNHLIARQSYFRRHIKLDESIKRLFKQTHVPSIIRMLAYVEHEPIIRMLAYVEHEPTTTLSGVTCLNTFNVKTS
ncbi:hypothetical protein HELRODRAFT_161147 [Helobdella robusta]|uniref:Uncharacterized protein n=1 Tax=Helobdella robusta TaxID=6412 RepID=T1ER55_HELRO|nr:hypothetical protein HELRODRAFT_161147 [Helobdella robusta]ESO01941.1 hypothetical protein HELRODRAFT_161147 [Helobdella robusta]